MPAHRSLGRGVVLGRESTLEGSQPRSDWSANKKQSVPQATVESAPLFFIASHAVLFSRMTYSSRNPFVQWYSAWFPMLLTGQIEWQDGCQPLRGWLPSSCPCGTNGSLPFRPRSLPWGGICGELRCVRMFATEHVQHSKCFAEPTWRAVSRADCQCARQPATSRRYK